MHAKPRRRSSCFFTGFNLSFLQHGRRVIWLKLWDPSKTKHDDMMCILYLVVLMLAREPKTQIAGISVISDQTGLCHSHMPSMRMVYSYQTLIKARTKPLACKIGWTINIKLFQGGAPVVFHDSHVLNITSMFKVLMKLAIQLAPERITRNIRYVQSLIWICALNIWH